MPASAAAFVDGPDRARTERARIDGLWVATLLAVAAVLVVRSWNAFAWPLLAADDGNLAAAFVADGSWQNVFAPYRGYVTLLPRVGAWLTTFAPFAWWPALYAAMSAAAAALALAAFASRRFATLLPDARSRALLCLLLALAPHGNARLVGSLMWSYASFGLLFALYALAPLPAPGPRRWLDTAWRALLCVSSPLSIATLPVLAWRAWHDRATRGDALHHAALALLALGYATWLCAPDPGLDHAPARLLAGWLRLVGIRVVAEAAVGGATWTELGAAAPWLAALLAIGIACLVRGLRGAPRAFAFGSLTMIALMCAATVWSRDHMGFPGTWWGNRYTYVPRVLLHLMVGIAIARRVRPTSPPRGLAIAGIAHALLLAAVGSEQYATRPADGAAVADFCARAEIWFEQDPRERAPLRLDRPGEWDLELR